MEPMNVLEVLLLIAMPSGTLEIAVEPLSIGKEPTSDGEADKHSRANNSDNKGARNKATRGGDDDVEGRLRAERASSWTLRWYLP